MNLIYNKHQYIFIINQVAYYIYENIQYLSVLLVNLRIKQIYEIESQLY